ncbi:MAG: HNH endonuclease, partial [Bdellovibrio sp.]
EKEAKEPLSSEEKMTIIKSIKGKTHREAQVTLAEVNPIAALPANKEKSLSKSHTQLQIVVDEETLALLKEIQALLSHTIPDGDYNTILNYMGKEVLQSLRKKKGRSVLAAPLILESTTTTTLESEAKMEMKKIAQTEVDKRTAEIELEEESKFQANIDKAKQCVYCETPKQGMRKFHSRYISQKVKRKIYARSNGQCEFVGVDGHRCTSRHLLEFDHVSPWSQQGSNDESNIQILCRTHNLYRTKKTHGFWYEKFN